MKPGKDAGDTRFRAETMMQTTEDLFTAMPAPTGQKHAAKTILVVEDEPDLRELVVQVLESCGYKVVEANSGQHALEQWARNRQVDLLLTDMVLPDGMTGSQLSDRLRREAPALRVMYTSGHSIGVGAQLANVDEKQFLPKPYRPADLINLVQRSLDTPQLPYQVTPLAA